MCPATSRQRLYADFAALRRQRQQQQQQQQHSGTSVSEPPIDWFHLQLVHALQRLALRQLDMEHSSRKIAFELLRVRATLRLARPCSPLLTSSSCTQALGEKEGPDGAAAVLAEFDLLPKSYPPHGIAAPLPNHKQQQQQQLQRRSTTATTTTTTTTTDAPTAVATTPTARVNLTHLRNMRYAADDAIAANAAASSLSFSPKVLQPAPALTPAAPAARCSLGLRPIG